MSSVDEWRSVPLKCVAGINERSLRETTDPTFEFDYIDIGSVGRGRLVEEPETVTFEKAPSRARRVVRQGDTIVSTVRTYLRAVLPIGPSVDATNTIVSTGFAVVSPRGPLESRYFGWVAQSDPFIEEVVAQSVGVSYPGINSTDLGRFTLSLPPLAAQRAVADFLDAETARIDALIAKKRRMVQLLDEQEQRAVLDAVGDWRGDGSRTLRQFGTTVLTGPFGTVLSASEYVRDGVPLINPTHIRNGHLVPEPEVSVPITVADRISRHRLHHGDLVMGRKGDVGRSALVPAEADGWLCGSDSIAIRCDATRLLAEFLALVLHVELYRQQLAKHSTGATLANVNESVLMSLKLPDRSVPQQAKAVTAGTRVRLAMDVLVGKVERQIELLQEHRQALITAAVTGALDVPGVAA